MKKMLTYTDTYMAQSTWKDMTLVKFCLVSLGVLIGLQIPKVKRKPAAIGSAIVFGTAYAVLMIRFFRVAGRKENEVEP